MEGPLQPVISFQALSNRKIRQKWAYSALFPADFRPNFQYQKLGLRWAGVHSSPAKVAFKSPRIMTPRSLKLSKSTILRVLILLSRRERLPTVVHLCRPQLQEHRFS